MKDLLETNREYLALIKDKIPASNYRDIMMMFDTIELRSDRMIEAMKAAEEYICQSYWSSGESAGAIKKALDQNEAMQAMRKFTGLKSYQQIALENSMATDHVEGDVNTFDQTEGEIS